MCISPFLPLPSQFKPPLLPAEATVISPKLFHPSTCASLLLNTIMSFLLTVSVVLRKNITLLGAYYMLGSMLDSRKSIRRLTSSSFSVAQKALIHLQPDSHPKITASGPNIPALWLKTCQCCFSAHWECVVPYSARIYEICQVSKLKEIKINYRPSFLSEALEPSAKINKNNSFHIWSGCCVQDSYTDAKSILKTYVCAYWAFIINASL